MKILFSIVLLVLSVSVNAAETGKAFGNIHKGNLKTGGSISFEDYIVDGNSNFSFGLSAPLEYFVADHFSLGGTFSYYHAENFNQFAVGPSASYFFLEQDRIAAHVEAGLFYSDSNVSTHSLITRAGIGMDYFFTPSVSFGPTVRFEHYFRDNGAYDVNDISLVGAFQIYL